MKKTSEVSAKFWWDTCEKLRVVFALMAIPSVVILGSLYSEYDVNLLWLIPVAVVICFTGERICYYFWLKIGEKYGYTHHFW